MKTQDRGDEDADEAHRLGFQVAEWRHRAASPGPAGLGQGLRLGPALAA
jgi:hypothetical protein